MKKILVPSKKDKQYFSKAVSDDSLPFEKLSIFNNLHKNTQKVV